VKFSRKIAKSARLFLWIFKKNILIAYKRPAVCMSTVRRQLTWRDKSQQRRSPAARRRRPPALITGRLRRQGRRSIYRDPKFCIFSVWRTCNNQVQLHKLCKQDNKLIIVNNNWHVINNKWISKQKQSKLSSLPILSGCQTYCIS